MEIAYAKPSSIQKLSTGLQGSRYSINSDLDYSFASAVSSIQIDGRSCDWRSTGCANEPGPSDSTDDPGTWSLPSGGSLTPSYTIHNGDGVSMAFSKAASSQQDIIDTIPWSAIEGTDSIRFDLRFPQEAWDLSYTSAILQPLCGNYVYKELDRFTFNNTYLDNAWHRYRWAFNADQFKAQNGVTSTCKVLFKVAINYNSHGSSTPIYIDNITFVK